MNFLWRDESLLGGAYMQLQQSGGSDGKEAQIAALVVIPDQRLQKALVKRIYSTAYFVGIYFNFRIGPIVRRLCWTDNYSLYEVEGGTDVYTSIYIRPSIILLCRIVAGPYVHNGGETHWDHLALHITLSGRLEAEGRVQRVVRGSPGVAPPFRFGCAKRATETLRPHE
ncbi:hypothetical protein M413DRAFT_13066 [Hebeloma cylindrosporum]|uniref:Uncharacterized protein n=1 Tax=Hebeloma cylindrosporum TaxID=76867 RepID=A0A0C3C0Q9_HEBCY|nr:hypothetical protein M413DRAFT_13066 [Hebeloma cylindrosporum h7]